MQFHFNGSYPKKKNWALDNLPIRNEWVLIVDADEVIPPALAEEIAEKVKNPDAKRPLKHTSESDWIYEHVIHNILFPECAYEFVGITLELGEIRVVLKQNAVSTEAFPTENQIEALLVREDRYFFGDGVVSVTDVGAHGDNVLLGDDGKVYFIDPLIRLGRTAEEVIEWLTGFNPATMSDDGC